jgi:endonuclease YncB( thermonuclease family)
MDPVRVRVSGRGAPSGRLFRFWVCCILIVLTRPSLTALEGGCVPDGPSAPATVARVVDGDTLRLSDGAWIRLIGIDTPEIGRDGDPSQPFAEAALDALSRLIPADGRVRIHPGPEAHDSHGRSLAHLSVAGRSLAASLLSQGVARLAVVPPNALQATCLATVEHEARRARRGLWQHPIPGYSAGLRRGFVLLSGALIRSEMQADGRWFGELEGGLWLTAYPSALSSYPHMVEATVGSMVEVRGWLSMGGHPRLIIRHPSQLSMVTEPPSGAGL